MKKFLIIITILLYQVNILGQNLFEFSENDSITIFGVDYTHTIFVGSIGFKDKASIANEYPRRWNELFKMENKKYSYSKYLNKKNVFYSQNFVNNKNSKITEEDFSDRLFEIDNVQNLLTIEDACKLAIDYNLNSDKSKFGIIIFAKEYNKITDIGSYIFIVLDTETNTVIYKKEVSGKTKGFGLRNYWARTYLNSLKELSKEYKQDLKEIKRNYKTINSLISN